MAIRKILTLEQPVLRAKAKKVSRFDAYLERLVADMFETMREAPGVGLAGPQIGESIRVLVAEYEDEHVALVNPEIIKMSEAEKKVGLSLRAVSDDEEKSRLSDYQRQAAAATTTIEEVMSLKDRNPE